MILKLIFFILFIIILFLLFFWISKYKIPFIQEHFSNIALYDNIYITNTINNNVICIETSGKDGFYISMTTSVVGSSPTYYSNLKMNLNGTDDIIDIQCANGNYWYFNYRASSYGPLGDGSGDNEKSTTPIDLSNVPSSSIFENALLFENGSMITFDITGTHMIISTVPVSSTPQKAQCIFALGTHDTTNLAGNTMTLLNISGNQTPPANYYYYNGQSGFNTDGTDGSGGVIINPFETTAIFVPNNTRQGIMQFTNGCFIDGSSATFTSGEQSLRFIGMGGTIQFNLNNINDMLQIWNPILSNYFYYNYSNQSGISEMKYNKYASSQTYLNMSYQKIGSTNPVNLLPYTPAIGNSIDSNNYITYNYVDQVIIYNPKSTNNFAILLQVDTCLWGENIGTMVQGTNNYSLTLSSVIYNPTNQTISSNPNAISKFSFNFNNGQGDLIEFIINNGTTSKNQTRYFYYNGSSNGFNNLGSQGATNTSGDAGMATTSFSVMPNNMGWNSKQTQLPTTTNIYAFRNTTPNLLVFENTINLQGGLKVGIDTNGNCIWKGTTGQLEFNLVKQNMGNNFNIFGLNSDGSIDYSLNNWTYNGTNTGAPIGTGISSGTVHHIKSWGDCGLQSTTVPSTNIFSETTGNFTVGSAIDQPLNSTTPSSWPCSNVTALSPEKNGLLVSFPSGYDSLPAGSVCVVEPDFTPLSLVSSNQTTNVVNGSSVDHSVIQIKFSNGMNLQGYQGQLMIEGLYGSYYTQLNSSSESYTASISNQNVPVFVQVQNSMVRNSGSSKNWTLGYTGYNGFDTTSITSNTSGITFS